MGFFSWRNQNTGKAIYNTYSGYKSTKSTMTDNKGNKWVENNYGGYGVFGGKDYYELLAEMNPQYVEVIGKKLFENFDSKNTNTEEKRNIGIKLEFDYDGEYKDVIFPNLNSNSKVLYNVKTRPQDANGQGHWREDYSGKYE